MSRKPNFISPGHFNELPIEPPFAFEDMTTSVLPLRAEIGSLQHLLDNTINFVPPQVARFRAALPYVFLMVIDYGKLALEATNLGWFSQTEVLFAVPACHYAWSGDAWVYRDLVWFAPFIFVDSDISLTLGRRVYGWAKLRHTMSADASNWLADPGGPQGKITLETPVFGELYAGHAQRPRVFCEVVRLSERAFEAPPDTSSVWLPWSMAKLGVDGLVGLGRDVSQMLSGGALTEPDALLAMATGMLSLANPFGAEARFQTVNLKQYRDEGRPELYAYQALTSACMRVTALKRIAPLTDVRRIGLDPSGGFRVRLHRWPMLPIADSLGLVTSRSWRGEGADVVEVEAVNPFWYQVDMLYERGHNLAERSIDGVWRTPHGRYRRRPSDTGRHGRGDEHGRARQRQRGRIDLDDEDALYNTSLSVSNLALAGPFDALDTTLQVLPLLADQGRIAAFIDEYLNEPLHALGLRFEPWASEGVDSELTSHAGPAAYVYLVVTNWGSIRSATDDVGDWKGEELSVFVPIRWYQDGQLMGAGLVPAVTYSATTAGVIANAEILGWPTRQAEFVRPQETWIDDPSQSRSEKLLTVNSEVLPTMGRGQEVQEETVLEIVNTSRRPSQATLQQWSRVLGDELARKQRRAASADLELEKSDSLVDARALALDFLVDGAPISIYSIKQIRDVYDPQRACYQSLTRVRRTLREVKCIERLPEGLTLTVQDYESNPLVDLLGLEATLVRSDEHSHCYWIKPVHPFWMNVSWREELGECLYYRYDDSSGGQAGWRPGPDRLGWESYFSNRHMGGRHIDARVAMRIDGGAPLAGQRFARAMAIDPNKFNGLRNSVSRDLLCYLPLVEQGLDPRGAPLSDSAATTIVEFVSAYSLEQLRAHACEAGLVVSEAQVSLGVLPEMFDGGIEGDLLPAIIEGAAIQALDSIAASVHSLGKTLLQMTLETLDEDELLTRAVSAFGPEGSEGSGGARILWSEISTRAIRFDHWTRLRNALAAKRVVCKVIELFVRALPRPSRATVERLSAALVRELVARLSRLKLRGRRASHVPPSERTAALEDKQRDWSEVKTGPGTAAQHSRILTMFGMVIDDVHARRVTPARARDIVRLFSPQMIIESMLSREWGSRAGTTRRRQARADLLARREVVRRGASSLGREDKDFLRRELEAIPGSNRYGMASEKHEALLEWVFQWYTGVMKLAAWIRREAGSGLARDELIERMRAVYASERRSRGGGDIDVEDTLISTLWSSEHAGGDWTKEIHQLHRIVASSHGTAEVIANLSKASEQLKLGFERVASLDPEANEARQLAELIAEARKSPGGWLHELVVHTRAAFEAEIERTLNVIVAGHGDPDFFVVPPFDASA